MPLLAIKLGSARIKHGVLVEGFTKRVNYSFQTRNEHLNAHDTDTNEKRLLQRINAKRGITKSGHYRCVPLVTIDDRVPPKKTGHYCASPGDG